MARAEVTGRKAGVTADLIERDVKPTPPPTPLREVKPEPRPPPTPRLALSIPEFCEAFGISEDFFYKLKRLGQGPRLMKVGARTLISLEAATEWAREREAAAT